MQKKITKIGFGVNGGGVIWDVKIGDKIGEETIVSIHEHQQSIHHPIEYHIHCESGNHAVLRDIPAVVFHEKGVVEPKENADTITTS